MNEINKDIEKYLEWVPTVFRLSLEAGVESGEIDKNTDIEHLVQILDGVLMPDTEPVIKKAKQINSMGDIRQAVTDLKTLPTTPADIPSTQHKRSIVNGLCRVRNEAGYHAIIDDAIRYIESA